MNPTLGAVIELVKPWDGESMLVRVRLNAVADACVADEREACARIAEGIGAEYGDAIAREISDLIAHKIRERGNQ